MAVETKGVKIPKDLHYRLKVIAVRKGVTLQSMITEILKKALVKMENQKDEEE
ncbi:MAG: hypothetical protein QXO76_00945 [Thermoproteota archaeon]